MPQPFVIIDGYNLMHATGLARRSYGPGDLEVCRHRLLQQLSDRLSDQARRRTTVVFDAFEAVSDDERHQNRHGLTVIYAPAGTDADSEIERIISSHDAPRQLLIVSGDHRLHRAAGRRRAKAIDSELFWESLAPESSETGSGSQDPRPRHDPEFDAEYLSDLESELDQ